MSVQGAHLHLISRKTAHAFGLKWYYTGKRCPKGHDGVRRTSTYKCPECDVTRSQQWRDDNPEYAATVRREYVAANPEKVREANQKSYKKHKDKRRATMAAWRERNKDKIREKKRAQYYADVDATRRASRRRYAADKDTMRRRRKEYYHANKEACLASNKEYARNNRAKVNALSAAYHRRKMDTCDSYRARMAARSMLRAVLLAAGKKRNRTRTEKILGYTNDEFKAHMKGLFHPGMSWDNHGEWHIDHIKPVSAFLKEGVTDMRVINALDNLQPLWAEENLKKGAKYASVP